MFAANVQNLQVIQQEDPVFWDHLGDIARELHASNRLYWNEHNMGSISDEVVDHLILVRSYNSKTGVPITGNKSEYNCDDPIAWVRPFYDATIGEFRGGCCLNNLYIPEVKVPGRPTVAVTTYATGTMVDREAYEKLMTGEVLCYRDEKQYILTTDDFMRVLLKQ